MGIRSVIGRDKRNISEVGAMIGNILRRAAKIEALQWPPNEYFDSTRQRTNPDPIVQIKRE